MAVKKTIVITGGAQGIGLATTRHFLGEGWNVAVWENDNEAINELTQLYPNPTLFVIQTDISSEANVKEALTKTIERFDMIDLLVNNAAIACNKPIGKLTYAEWQRVISVNLSGTFLCSKYCADYLKRSKGTIVNIASTRAFQSEPHTEAYSASKGGIIALTHALAISLGPEVRVNSISPGWIDVSASKKSSIAEQIKLSEQDHSQHPVGRVGIADDIVNMIDFLANEKNSFITGQNFTVDGGMTRKMIYV